MITKVQILAEEFMQGDQEFWEDSPPRTAMKQAKAKLSSISGEPLWFFVHEKNDGLWIAFLDESSAEAFTNL